MIKFILILFTLWNALPAIYAQNEKELKVAFTSIDSAEYLTYKSEYTNPLVIDTNIHTMAGASFTLSIKDTTKTFECAKGYAPCFYYKGFLPFIHCYVLTHCTMYTCETFLIDQQSGEHYALPSPFDSECQPPLLSKNQTSLLVVASNSFDKESFISIYHRSDTTQPFQFHIFESLLSNQWKINEAVWINETTFALKTYEKYGGPDGNTLLNVQYLKGIIQ